MSILSIFRRGEKRSSTAMTGDDLVRLIGSMNVAGEHVTPRSALNISTFFCGVQTIADEIATLPYKVHQRTGESRRIATDHPAYRLLATRPNREQTAFQFWWWLVAATLIWGNGYAVIRRRGGAGTGTPVALWPVHPSRVKMFYREVDGQFGKFERRFYAIKGAAGEQAVEVPDVDMFHIWRFTIDGETGVGILEAMADTLGVAQAMQRYSGAFFKNGATPLGVLKTVQKLSDEQMSGLKRWWDTKLGGSGAAHGVEVMPHGIEFTQIGVDPSSAQLLDSRKFSVEEFARFLKMPSSRLGSMEKSTYNNREQDQLQFVQSTLTPWLRCVEQEADYKLFTLRESDAGYYTRFNVNGLLRGDHASRSKYYQTGRLGGWLSANEIRAMEDMDGIGDEGDTYLVQGQMRDLANLEQDSDSGGAMRAFVRDAAARVVTKSIDRLKRAIKKSTTCDELIAAVETHFSERSYVGNTFANAADAFEVATGRALPVGSVLTANASDRADELRSAIIATKGDLEAATAAVTQMLTAWRETEPEAITAELVGVTDDE
jgi:HK97 family phage portal protein